MLHIETMERSGNPHVVLRGPEHLYAAAHLGRLSYKYGHNEDLTRRVNRWFREAGDPEVSPERRYSVEGLEILPVLLVAGLSNRFRSLEAEEAFVTLFGNGGIHIGIEYKPYYSGSEDSN